MQHRFTISLLICLIILSYVTPVTAGPTSAAPVTYYVSTNGSDSNSGLSEAASFATIDKGRFSSLGTGSTCTKTGKLALSLIVHITSNYIGGTTPLIVRIPAYANPVARKENYEQTNPYPQRQST